MAERWETSPDGTAWTFFLRRGVQFHRGFGELTSEDVRYSFERVADPEVKAVNTIYFVLMVKDWAEQGQNSMMALIELVVLGTHAWGRWSVGHAIGFF